VHKTPENNSLILEIMLKGFIPIKYAWYSKGNTIYDPANIPGIRSGNINKIKVINATPACAIYAATDPYFFFARLITPEVFRILYSTLISNLRFLEYLDFIILLLSSVHL
jgi:hypothetical protein